MYSLSSVFKKPFCHVCMNNKTASNPLRVHQKNIGHSWFYSQHSIHSKFHEMLLGLEMGNCWWRFPIKLVLAVIHTWPSPRKILERCWERLRVIGARNSWILLLQSQRTFANVQNRLMTNRLFWYLKWATTKCWPRYCFTDLYKVNNAYFVTRHNL